MKIIISTLLILFAFNSYSQNSAPNTFTLSKNVIAKASTMNDFISNFPKEHVLINFGIAYFVKNKAKSASGDVTFDALKKILKEADLKSEVHMELKYKSGENKTDATYVFKITE